MRIPSAYFDGSLGHRVAEVAPALQIDTSGSDAIARAGERLGATLLNTATNANEHQGRIDLMQAQENKSKAERLMREQEAELKQLNKDRETGAAKREYLNFTPALSNIQQQIIDDPNILPEEYPVKIRERAQQLASETLYPKLNERQKLLIEPMVMEHTNQISEQAFKAGKKEISDGAWADTLSTLDALVNDPTRDARTKIEIIKDDNLFSDTGRTAVEIETEKEKRISKVTENEVQGIFNDKGAVTAMKFLDAKNSDGSYVNLPELHIDKREAFIGHAADEIKRLEAEARREARERKALQNQQTHNLFESMKTMLDDGYPLPANVDVQARMAFKGTRYEPLFAAVKQKANSLEFRTELINKDSLLYFARSKGYNIPPLDLTNPATIPQQMAARAPFAKEAQKALNLPYTPYFFAGEQKAIGQQLETLDGPNRVKSVKVWSDILGPQNMTQFAKQVSGTHSNDPAKNTALGLEIALAANGKDKAAQWIASGRDYLKTAKLSEPARKSQNTTFEKIAGSALKGLYQGRDDYRNAVNAAYVHLAKSQGIDVENSSAVKELYEQAFKSVVGDTTYINGKTTIVPTGMTPDGFRNSINRITPEIVTAAGGVKGLDPKKAADLLRSEASPWEAGEGVYSFQLGGKQVKTNDGKPFKLRFNK